ncbi:MULTISPECIES: hypothetical protein [unclassified Ruegeria]|uniref:hypothetical protein n=1 Tax=unclassified Ruegeria TaxID=2625375 RepID=UPI001488ADD2|nr:MULTISPECIES: hypothetical protein [unclassified Ruegeria]
MSPLKVAPKERGVLRMFALDMPPEEAKFQRELGAADQMLGIVGLAADQIDVFPVSDLEDMGLYGYLHEGCGVSLDQLDRTALEAVKGWVMVVRSAAFGGRALRLEPDPRVHLVGLYTEEATNWTGGKIETESAKPFSAPQAASSDQSPQRLGSAVLAVLALLIIGGALWLIL